jgi:hypothetical protein
MVMAITAAADPQFNVGTVRSRGWMRQIRIPTHLLGEYPFVAVSAFLGLLASLVAVRAALPDAAVRDMPWLLVVAIIPILPWLVPLAAKHLSGLRAGPLQLDFRAEVKPATKDIEELAMKLSGAPVADLPTRSRDIVTRAKEIEAERTEVLLINLSGGRWQLAPLYFFAFLLESRTIVRRLVLEESRGEGERTFVGMCSPHALRRSIEREYPLYKNVRKSTPIVELGEGGESFFRALTAAAAGRPEEDYSPPVDAGRLAQVLGPALERDTIDKRELEGAHGLRRVLNSERRYLAIVENGCSYCVLDQYRVSLDIARRATDR